MTKDLTQFFVDKIDSLSTNMGIKMDALVARMTVFEDKIIDKFDSNKDSMRRESEAKFASAIEFQTLKTHIKDEIDKKVESHERFRNLIIGGLIVANFLGVISLWNIVRNMF